MHPLVTTIRSKFKYAYFFKCDAGHNNFATTFLLLTINIWSNFMYALILNVFLIELNG